MFLIAGGGVAGYFASARSKPRLSLALVWALRYGTRGLERFQETAS